ncbi:MAG: helix-turn-helix domain-containing protein [Noviherbaspirillum sp.]
MVDVSALASAPPDDFRGSLTLYGAGDVVLSHCRSDAMRIHRGLDRISRDGMAHCVFHVILDGGQGRAIFGGRELVTRPGDILMLDFDQPFTIERESYSALGLFVPRAMLFPHLDLIGQPVRVAARGTAFTAMVYDWAHALLRHLPALSEPAVSQAIASYLPLLAGCFSQENSLAGDQAAQPSRALCRRIAEYITANREDPDLSISSVAEHFGLSRAGLYRVFAGAHEGPSAMIRRYRLKAAVNDVLHRPDMPIAQIAYAAGFGTPASFSTAFRRACGLSPQQLRQSHVSGRFGTGRGASQAGYPYAEILGATARQLGRSA